jgi:hypothetical protein
MELTFQKTSALIIVIGSLFFMIAAFSPVSRVFAISDSGEKLELILNERLAWNISQFFFAAGAAVTVTGLGMTGITFNHQLNPGLIYTCLVLLAAGTILWAWHVYLRATDPQLFTTGEIPVWLFAGYTLLTQAGLVIFGLMLLKTGLPAWVGQMMIGSMIFFFILTVIFRDMPPFVYYIITLITGVMIWRADSLVLT